MSESVGLNGSPNGTSTERRREQLAEFLKTRRARLSPVDVGLPPGRRRRTPGLRREEVALLASVGVSWYTSLEQGRDVKPSAQVLEGIAEALRLSPEERRHLRTLADQNPPQDLVAPAQTASPTLRTILDDLGTCPAYAISAPGDLTYWNLAAERVFMLSSPIRPPHERNLLWRLFVEPETRKLYASWEETARATLAHVRADFANYPGDARFEALVEDLTQASPEFREWWPEHDVSGEPDGRKRLLHPEVGPLVLEYSTLHVPADPDLRVNVYAPSTQGDFARLTKLAEAFGEREG